MRTVIIAGLLAGVLSVAGCDSAPDTAKADRTDKPSRPKVVCTIAMIADVVRNVGGDAIEVQALIGAGVDPHLYQPTRNDIVQLQGADLVFYNGLMLEGKLSDVLVKLARGGQQVYAVTEELDKSTLLQPPDMEGHYDPHVWMDVMAWSETVDVIADALRKLMPAEEARFASNAADYKAKLGELDAYVRRVLNSIPEQQRILVTAHDAFNYFGRAYKLEVRGIQGLSTESEAGLEDINSLVEMIVKRQVQAVFVETSVSDRNIQALIEGADARGQKVTIGGSLFSDAMGAHGTYEGTYLGMLDHNATQVARALGGEAPPQGMAGKLSVEGSE